MQKAVVIVLTFVVVVSLGISGYLLIHKSQTDRIAELRREAKAEAAKGAIVGATDEIGAEAAEVAHPIRDLHVTLLHLLGLDDNKLTYFHGGRYKQLSQFGGQVIKELIA